MKLNNINILEMNGGLTTSFPFSYDSNATFANVELFSQKNNLALNNKNVLYFLEEYKPLIDKVIPFKDLKNKVDLCGKLTQIITDNTTNKLASKKQLKNDISKIKGIDFEL